MENCLFCKIIAGEIPSTEVYSDEYVYAFLDIDPQAPFHAVIVPKMHIKCADEINAENSFVVAKIFEAVAKIAEKRDLPTATAWSTTAVATEVRRWDICIFICWQSAVSRGLRADHAGTARFT